MVSILEFYVYCFYVCNSFIRRIYQGLTYELGLFSNSNHSVTIFPWGIRDDMIACSAGRMHKYSISVQSSHYLSCNVGELNVEGLSLESAMLSTHSYVHMYFDGSRPMRPTSIFVVNGNPETMQHCCKF